VKSPRHLPEFLAYAAQRHHLAAEEARRTALDRLFEWHLRNLMTGKDPYAMSDMR